MSFTFLLDMNIPPSWASLLVEEGLQAVHWSNLGEPNATDEAIMAYARLHGHIVITHDLDFTHLLALTHAAGPSVILLRKQYALTQQQAISKIAQAIIEHKSLLISGALIVIDAARSRVRTLPLDYAND